MCNKQQIIFLFIYFFIFILFLFTHIYLKDYLHHFFQYLQLNQYTLIVLNIKIIILINNLNTKKQNTFSFFCASRRCICCWIHLILFRRTCVNKTWEIKNVENRKTKYENYYTTFLSILYTTVFLLLLI